MTDLGRQDFSAKQVTVASDLFPPEGQGWVLPKQTRDCDSETRAGTWDGKEDTRGRSRDVALALRSQTLASQPIPGWRVEPRDDSQIQVNPVNHFNPSRKTHTH